MAPPAGVGPRSPGRPASAPDTCRAVSPEPTFPRPGRRAGGQGARPLAVSPAVYEEELCPLPLLVRRPACPQKGRFCQEPNGDSVRPKIHTVPGHCGRLVPVNPQAKEGVTELPGEEGSRPRLASSKALGRSVLGMVRDSGGEAGGEPWGQHLQTSRRALPRGPRGSQTDVSWFLSSLRPTTLPHPLHAAGLSSPILGPRVLLHGVPFAP